MRTLSEFLIGLSILCAFLYVGQLLSVQREFSGHNGGKDVFSEYQTMNFWNRLLLCLIPGSTYFFRNLLKRREWELTCLEHNMLITKTPRHIVKRIPTAFILFSALFMHEKPERAV